MVVWVVGDVFWEVWCVFGMLSVWEVVWVFGVWGGCLGGGSLAGRN